MATGHKIWSIECINSLNSFFSLCLSRFMNKQGLLHLKTVWNQSFFNVFFIDEQLQHTVRDFFGAGTETTSTLLLWALLYLVHHQEWQKNLQEDIDDVVGVGQPKMEHKERLPRVEHSFWKYNVWQIFSLWIYHVQPMKISLTMATSFQRMPLYFVF